MERLELGPDALLAANPKLVYGRVTGWGQDGPLAAEAGHDINYLAMTGLLHGIGPKERPVVPINYLGDYAGGGMMLAFGMVAALLAVQRGGKGQVIDAAMSDGAALIGALTYGLRAAGAWRDEREANLLDGGDPAYGVYRCLDGKFLALGAIEPQFRASLFKGLALPDGAGREEIATVIATRSRDDWARHFAGHRRLRRAGARPGRSAGPSAQYRAAHLHRPRRRVPARAGAALFAHDARPPRSAAARGAGWRGDPCRAWLWRGRDWTDPRMNPLYETMATSVFERMSLAAAQHEAINLGQGFPDFGWPDDDPRRGGGGAARGVEPICAVARAAGAARGGRRPLPAASRARAERRGRVRDVGRDRGAGGGDPGDGRAGRRGDRHDPGL